MSTKKTTPEKNRFGNPIEGSLKKLIKQYEGYDINSRIEGNLQGAKLTFFPISTPTISLFNLDYYNLLIDKDTESDRQLFPIYLFVDHKKTVVFAGFHEYAKILQSGNKEFQGYLIDNITEPEAIFFFLEEIKKSQDSPLLLAYAYQNLKERYNISYRALSEIVGISKSQIINMIHILSLPKEIIDAVKTHKLTYALARPLNGLENDQQKIALFHRIIADGLTAREVEESVYEYKNPNCKYLNKVYIVGNKVTVKCKNRKAAARLADRLKDSDILS